MVKLIKALVQFKVDIDVLGDDIADKLQDFKFIKKEFTALFMTVLLYSVVAVVATTQLGSFDYNNFVQSKLKAVDGIMDYFLLAFFSLLFYKLTRVDKVVKNVKYRVCLPSSKKIWKWAPEFYDIKLFVVNVVHGGTIATAALFIYTLILGIVSLITDLLPLTVNDYKSLIWLLPMTIVMIFVQVSTSCFKNYILFNQN